MMDACSFIARFPSQMDLYPWRHQTLEPTTRATNGIL